MLREVKQLVQSHTAGPKAAELGFEPRSFKGHAGVIFRSHGNNFCLLSGGISFDKYLGKKIQPAH